MKAWMRSVLEFVGILAPPRRPTSTRARISPARKVSVVESLERREVLSGAGVPFASIPAMVVAKGQPAHVVVDFDAGELASDRSPSILLGLYARPTTGSALVPNISEVQSSSGRQTRSTLPQRGTDAAAKALFITSVPIRSGQAQDIAVNVTGQNDKVGGFNLEVFLPGDANGDGVVNATDLAIIDGIYGSAEGQSNFNPAADFNGDGHVGCIDRRVTEINQGARAVYTPVVAQAPTPAVTTPVAPAAPAPAPVEPAAPAPAPVAPAAPVMVSQAVTPPVATTTVTPVVATQAVSATPVVITTPVQTTAAVSSVQVQPVVVAPIQTATAANPGYAQVNATVPVYAVQTAQAAVPTYVQAPSVQYQSGTAGPVYYSGQTAVQAPVTVSLTNAATMPGVAYYYGQPVVQSPGFSQTISNQSATPGMVYYGQPVIQAPGTNASMLPGVVYYYGQPAGQVPVTS